MLTDKDLVMVLRMRGAKEKAKKAEIAKTAQPMKQLAPIAEDPTAEQAAEIESPKEPSEHGEEAPVTADAMQD